MLNGSKQWTVSNNDDFPQLQVNKVLTICSQSSLRSSLSLVGMLGRPPSVTWLGSTVNSFTLSRGEKIELVRYELTPAEKGLVFDLGADVIWRGTNGQTVVVP